MSRHTTRMLLAASREWDYVEPPKRYTKHAQQRQRERTGGIEVVKRDFPHGPEVVITVLPMNAHNVRLHKKKQAKPRVEVKPNKKYRRANKRIKCGIDVKTFPNRPDVIVGGWVMPRKNKRHKKCKKHHRKCK